MPRYDESRNKVNPPIHAVCHVITASQQKDPRSRRAPSSQARKRKRDAAPDGRHGTAAPNGQHATAASNGQHTAPVAAPAAAAAAAEPAHARPSAHFRPTGRPRAHTLSVALPASLIGHAQTHDRRTALAGSVARALAVFCVDEVVVFEDTPAGAVAHDPAGENGAGNEDDGRYTGDTLPGTFLRRLLSYLETPPHLRRALWGMHPDLRTAGKLPSLDMPHHGRADEWRPYREGVALPPADGAAQPEATEDAPVAKRKRKGKQHAATDEAAAADTTPPTTLVDAGLAHPVPVPGAIPANARVTLRFTAGEDPPAEWTRGAPLPAGSAAAVAPTAPRDERGWYWGYAVRGAGSLAAVLTEAPCAGGYDLVVGTSERGRPLDALLREARSKKKDEGKRWREWRHLLICFGGVAGLEAAVRDDAELRAKGVERAEELFDEWVDLCPEQGSRTVRTEEALWMGLMGLSGVVRRRARAQEEE